MPLRKWTGRKSNMRGSHNTRRENRLEELGRVDAEKAYTGKGKRNLRDEKKRIVRELKADGGRAATRPPEQKRRPKAGPSAPKPRKKFFQTPKTYGGGPDSGNIGKIKDMLSKYKDARKGLGKKVPKPDLSKLKEKMPKYVKPLGKRVKKRNGGSAAEHYLQHGYGPHKSSGKVLKGKKIGIQIK